MEILERIKIWWKEQGAGSTRKITIHSHSARLHKAKSSMDFVDTILMT
jgi:hypothetical protein